MLSKEEVEILNKYIELINKDYCSDCNELNCIDNFPHKKISKAIKNAILYIQHLESDKQKLIEKLEKDIKKNNEFEFMPLQIEKAYNNYYKLGKIDESQEILKILKREK